MKKVISCFYIIIFINAVSISTTAFAQQPSAQTNKIYFMGTNLPVPEIERIKSALPSSSSVKPLKPRKLLIFDLNVNYGGHRSAAYANIAFKMMGERTGAFEAVISHDVQSFKKENLRQFDAVFFNNNVGNIFEDSDLRENLAEFVYGGGGLMGVHGTSVAFTKWPGAIEDWQEFGIMLGARGANHRESTERVVMKIEDETHPLTRVFGGKQFEYRDEFFRFHDVYSRERVRVLLSIDTNKTELDKGKMYGNTIRKDNDYAISWVRSYGKGRVFYSTIAHNPYVFYDPIMLRFYLDAAQFVLGDLKAPTTPSARLDEKTSAFEKLGWRVGVMSEKIATRSLEDLCKTARDRNLLFASVDYGIKAFNDSDTVFSISMSQSDRRKYRLMLDKYGVRVNCCRVEKLPESEGDLEKLLEFMDVMGIENVIVKADNLNLDKIQNLAEKYTINIALDYSKASFKSIVNRIRQFKENIGVFLTIDRDFLKTKGNEVNILSKRLFAIDIQNIGVDNIKELEKILKSLNKMGGKEIELLINLNDEKGFLEVENSVKKVAIELASDKNKL